MKILVLPGYSLHNREWAYEVKKKLSFKHSILVHGWAHWRLGGTLKPKHEVELILKEIGREKIDLIAKSVGTMVAMLVLRQAPEKINKIILCGIPSVSPERLTLFQEALENFPEKDIICFQNTADPLAGYIEVKEFMEKVNSEIEVIEESRHDHNYPYFEEFEKFLR
jgi:pimeloyl-ACP methyl ester carboxylesterase